MTGNDVIEEVNRLLLSGSREEMNILEEDVEMYADTLTFRYDLGGIRPGSELDIELETYRVWTVDAATKTAQVRWGMNGTQSDAHRANNLVYVNPRFSRAAVFAAINNEILSLSGQGLFHMTAVEFDYEGARTDYPLDWNVLEVYEVRQPLPGPENAWTKLDWKWIPQADPSYYPSGTGNGIHLIGGYPGREVQVVYRSAFYTLDDPDQDLIRQAKLAESMQDIVVLGVLLRLGPVREIKRSFTEAQGDARRAEEVASGNIQNSFASVRALYQDRIRIERTRLMQQYPVYHR